MEKYFIVEMAFYTVVFITLVIAALLPVSRKSAKWEMQLLVRVIVSAIPVLLLFKFGLYDLAIVIPTEMFQLGLVLINYILLLINTTLREKKPGFDGYYVGVIAYTYLCYMSFHTYSMFEVLIWAMVLLWQLTIVGSKIKEVITNK